MGKKQELKSLASIEQIFQNVYFSTLPFNPTAQTADRNKTLLNLQQNGFKCHLGLNILMSQ